MSRRSLDPVELTGQRFISHEAVHVRSLDHRFTIRRDLPDGEWKLTRAEPVQAQDIAS